MDTPKLLVNEREAWTLLGIGRSTLRRLEAEGKLRRIKIGRAVRYPVGELERFVAELAQNHGIG